MLLWNALLPAILGVGTITFWQALGILVLSKILFGGFSGHGHGRSRYHDHHRHYRMREKWMHMSPEEREKMKAEYDSHCCEDKKE
jgi:Ca2+/H+ antiporter, TMEM165/GDT1 family